MRTPGRLRNSLLVVGSMLLVGACAGDTDTPAPQGSSASSSNASPAAPASANGELYTSTFGGGETTCAGTRSRRTARSAIRSRS